MCIPVALLSNSGSGASGFIPRNWQPHGQKSIGALPMQDHVPHWQMPWQMPGPRNTRATATTSRDCESGQQLILPRAIKQKTRLAVTRKQNRRCGLQLSHTSGGEPTPISDTGGGISSRVATRVAARTSWRILLPLTKSCPQGRQAA